MAIKGSLKEASLPDVLQLLALGQKTGCLALSDRSNLGYIYFENGRICFASIVNRRDRFGDVLVKRGKITREQLESAVTAQETQRDRKLGEIMVELGVISRADMEEHVRIQVEEAVYYLFTWSQGTFRFDADVAPEGVDVALSINPQSLLLEGARRVDEWSLIKKRIPSLDHVYAVEQEHLDEADVELTPQQTLLVSLMDGKRTAFRLREESGLSEFETGKALYGLVTAGFAHRVRGPQESPSGGAAVEARVEEHRNLGVAFYKTGMLDEAAREFRRVVELKEGEAGGYFYLGLVAAQQGDWADAERAFRRAAGPGGRRPSVLANLALSLEKLGRLEEADSTYGDAVDRARRDPRVLTGWGITAMRLKKFEESQGRLDRAREVAADAGPPEVWYWARSMIAAVTEDYETAESVLREGIQRYPRSVVLRNNLAALLEVLGDSDQAEQILRAITADGLVLPQASKNLGDILYRAGRYDDAWEAYQQAVKLNPELGDDVYFKLGNIAYKRMDHPVASEMWNKTIELNPKHQLARTNIETMSALL
ncbi:MAG: tetratricopeptide repeat protein [Gemmatimonadetes bacterium]|nr:tetratricopeptide repeat protein [Gemmatimonadota bacterium]